ncbi:MAG: Histidinol-phosphate aminotransferase [Anaerolineales bacterium]|nr:Histidinol-phosphate aminotransferase [Anaerolineales bacterium]
MTKSLSYVRPEVRALTPYSLKQPECQIKLNMNENCFGFPDELKEEVWRRLRRRDWARYPDFHPRGIIEGLADHTGVPADWVFVGNGSNDLLQMTLLATLTRETKMIVPAPTFTVYRLQGAVMGATVIEPCLHPEDFSLPVEQLVATIEAEHPALVLVCSPNNPTGNTYPSDQVRPIIEAATDSLILLDEAYVEFSDQNFHPLLSDHENVALLRTFSKAWGLAGARVGYMIAHPSFIQQIRKVKLPYGLNILSETAALVALEHVDLLSEQVTHIIEEREKLFTALKRLPGVRPYPSETNFILCQFDRPTDEVFNACIEAGILIRDVSHYPNLESHLRISVGSEQENTALIDALSNFLMN